MVLMDYLKWRNDVTFSVSAFNEVDNVILSYLSYIDFGELYGTQDGIHDLEEVFCLFCQKHSLEDIRENGSFTQRAPLLLEEIVNGDRFKKIKVGYYYGDLDKEKVKQFAAVVFILPDGVNYISFRGTDSTITGWKENFFISYMSETEGAKEAICYLNKIAKVLKGDLILGGHSKGGNFAIYAAAFSDDSIKNRIIRIYNNDGPGFRDEVINSNGYQMILPKIQSIIPQTSIIGQLLSNKGKQKVICSKVNGIFQHDAMTWEVTKDKFVPAELDDFSRFVKATLGNWLEKLDDETRCSLISTVFSMVEETESETFREFGGDLIKNAVTLIKGFVKLPGKKKKELVAALGALINSSGKATINHLAQSSKQ